MSAPSLIFDKRLGRYRDTKTGRIVPNTNNHKNINQVTFECKFCGEAKPLDEMRILARFFPQLVACRTCEKLYN